MKAAEMAPPQAPPKATPIRRWEQCLSQSKGLQRDLVACSQAMRHCRRWPQAVSLLGLLPAWSLQKDPMSYSCGLRRLAWPRGLVLLERLRADGLQASAISCHLVLRACHWCASLALLKAMDLWRLEVSVVSFSSALATLKDADLGGEVALGLLRALRRRELQADAICYTCAMAACAWRAAELLLAESADRAAPPDVAALGAARRKAPWRRAAEAAKKVPLPALPAFPWPHALGLAASARAARLGPPKAAPKAATAAAAAMGLERWRGALSLLKLKGLRLDSIACSTCINACSDWALAMCLLDEIYVHSLQATGGGEGGPLTAAVGLVAWVRALSLLQQQGLEASFASNRFLATAPWTLALAQRSLAAAPSFGLTWACVAMAPSQRSAKLRLKPPMPSPKRTPPTYCFHLDSPSMSPSSLASPCPYLETSAWSPSLMAPQPGRLYHSPLPARAGAGPAREQAHDEGERPPSEASEADEPAPEEVSDLEAPPEDPEDGEDGLAPPESDVTELSEESESGVEPPLEKLEASKAAAKAASAEPPKVGLSEPSSDEGQPLPPVRPRPRPTGRPTKGKEPKTEKAKAEPDSDESLLASKPSKPPPTTRPEQQLPGSFWSDDE
ncbi:unnamed protein product [Effrenium voratum]|uniref:Uncharacterized protein n=1 Tax=Effrenium voratum TaxID=2562239 RepID=A0AA36N0N1_9DINO|nr:unnamed protein product [Effrenium voratum]